MGKSRTLIPVLVVMMLATGVANTLLTKYQDMQCVADCETSHPKTFEQPVIQTLQMFVGESGCWLVVGISFLLRYFRMGGKSGGPAYQPVGARDSSEEEDGERTDDEDAEEEVQNGDMTSSQTLVDPTNVVAKAILDGEEVPIERRPLEGWKVTLLALPAICDILGTTLMNAGLLLVAASIYQMVRGALVLFVGLFSVLFLKRRLGGWKWMSLFIVVLGVAIVGLAGALERHDTDDPSADLPGDTQPGGEHDILLPTTAHRALLVIRDAITTTEAHTAAESVLGVLLIAGAQIFTATQFVLEESIMEKYCMDPIQVVGWEGIFGFTVTLIGMGVLHGVNGKGYFNAAEAFYEVFTNRTIAVTSLLIMISIGYVRPLPLNPLLDITHAYKDFSCSGFNFFGLSVTRVISATSRSTIDTCRTLFIWIVSLGLGWESFKWLQVLGFALLVYGTALFNEIVNPPSTRFLRSRRRRGDIVVGEQR